MCGSDLQWQYPPAPSPPPIVAQIGFVAEASSDNRIIIMQLKEEEDEEERGECEDTDSMQ